MGDVADMMLDGTLCEGCGVFLNDYPPGYPCYCDDCTGPYKQYKPAPSEKIKCPTCGKKVKAIGLADHIRMVHNG